MATKKLTIPDLVVLSLLSEQAMHGYQVVEELELREVRDWAGISRPQVYYCLKKLASEGLIAPAVEKSAAAGPERRIYVATPSAKRALQLALSEEHWATQRPPPPFLTWMVLSGHASPSSAASLLERRRRFLEAEICREKETLREFAEMPRPLQKGPSIAQSIVKLAIRQFELELAWLDEAALVLGVSLEADASGP